MLNKELLMAGSDSLVPVLSIYIAPAVNYAPTISGTLSSGEPFYVSDSGETIFKFSELDPTAIISVRYYEDAQLSTTNLKPRPTPYSVSARWAPSVMVETSSIEDRTQSASILIE